MERTIFGAANQCRGRLVRSIPAAPNAHSGLVVANEVGVRQVDSRQAANTML
jgi:hypothetical protein